MRRERLPEWNSLAPGFITGRFHDQTTGTKLAKKANQDNSFIPGPVIPGSTGNLSPHGTPYADALFLAEDERDVERKSNAHTLECGEIRHILILLFDKA